MLILLTVTSAGSVWGLLYYVVCAKAENNIMCCMPVLGQAWISGEKMSAEEGV